MTDEDRCPLFSPESLLNSDKAPKSSSLFSSSRELGWNTILLDAFVTHGAQEESYCSITPDVVVSVGLAGAWDLSVKLNGRWASAVLHSGSVNIGTGGEPVEMRWRNRHANVPFRIATAYVPPILLEEATDYFRRPGQRVDHRIPSSLVINDQVIASTVRAMMEATERGFCELYGEQASRWLATHLVHAHGHTYDPASDTRNIGTISDIRLMRVIDYMRANLASPMTITELANVAAVSPFHFCRLFSSAVGMSPHRYLVDRRMQKAEALLRATEISLTEVATECGYFRANAFSIAFQRRYGHTPAAYRRRERL